MDYCFNCMKEMSDAGKCPHCGFDNGTYEHEAHHLRPHTILYGKYLVGRVLGEGGFGITYVGLDLNLQMKVAIKEYYPNGYVTRTDVSLGQVTVLTGKRSAFFYKGQEQFIGEARRLAKFWGLPGIVAVKDYFQENGTAYIVMEFAEGRTMKTMLEENGQKMSADQVLKMIRPVMSSLQKVHEEGLIHRDISPDNLMVCPDGGVKLLDFGAARDYIAEQEKSISVILKPGYAPEEQYRSSGHQGPWTDVYALCATIYRAVTGNVPVEALDRLAGEALPKPSELGVKITRIQEHALMKGLSIQTGDRYQNMKELEAALYQLDSALDSYGKQNEKKQEEEKITSGTEKKSGGSKGKIAGILAGCCVLAAAGAGIVYYNSNRLVERTVTYDSGDRYEGQMRRDVREGTGTYYWADGAVYTGEWTDGKQNGTGTMEWPSGTRYEGDWVAGIYEGKGTYYYTDGAWYEGDWKNEQRHGTGTYHYADGDYMEGTYVDGEAHGSFTYYDTEGNIFNFEFEHGELIKDGETEKETEKETEGLEVRTVEYDNGNRYEGQMRGDVREGTGTYYWADGDRYEGEFADGTQNGTGTYYWADGVVYTGEWKNGNRTGIGTITYPEDETANPNKIEYYEGEWVDGKKNGTGTVVWLDGDRYEGEFADDNMDGTGTYYYANGYVYTGEWKDGKITGTGTMIYPEDETVNTNKIEYYEGEWVDGEKTGSGTMVWLSGTRYEGEWKEDKRNGFGIFYYTEDDVNGSDRFEGNYADGKRNGFGTYYWKDGSHYSGEYVNDERHGAGTYYDADGNAEERVYENGERVDNQ